jgi:hypothetical protein
MRKEKPMTKVNWKGMYPPDHPIYKEGWSIAIQPPKEKEKPAPRPRPKKPQGKEVSPRP